MASLCLCMYMTYGAGLLFFPFLRRRCTFFLGVLDLVRLPLLGDFDLDLDFDLDCDLFPFLPWLLCFRFLLLLCLLPRSEDFRLPLPLELLRPRLVDRPPLLPLRLPLPLCAGATGAGS